jgi:hypothetical protein
MKKNLAEQIFLAYLDVMKTILDLGEYKLDRDQKAYKYFKKVVMDSFYTKLQKLFAELEKDGLLEKCACKSNLRNGYTQCPTCHGAGMKNISEIEEKKNRK